MRDFKRVSLNILLNQLQNYFDTPKNQRRPLEWTFDLLSFLPSQRKYTLNPYLSFSEFKNLKKEISFLKGKGENQVAYTHLEFSEADIQKLANKAIKKARKNKTLVAISDKLAVFTFPRDEWVSKNLLNLLLYALTHRNQARIILKIIELSLPAQDLLLGKEQFERYLNSMTPITDEDLPKLFYELMTTSQINAIKVKFYQRLLCELKKREDGVSDQFLDVYSKLGITKKDKLAFIRTGRLPNNKYDVKCNKMKGEVSNYFLNWPFYSTFYHASGQDYSFCKVNGFTINGLYNVAFNFSYADLKKSTFYNPRYIQDFSFRVVRKTNGLRFFTFFNADLRHARFKNLLISESDFRFSNMQSVFFYQADCQSCDFSFANFSNVSFLSFRAVDCDFTGVNFDLAENEIIKIQLSACKNHYSKDWFVFLERHEGYDLCQNRLNHALLLALRTAQNASWFSHAEKMILTAIIRSIEFCSDKNIKHIFDHYLLMHPDFCSERFRVFLSDLESGSRKFLRPSATSSVESALEVSLAELGVFVERLVPDFIPKPEERPQQADFLVAKFLAYFSEPLSNIINKKKKFPREIASCLHPAFKMRAPFLAVVREHAEAVLVYALFHPKWAKVCLAILSKAFESSRITFEKMQMTSEDMPKEIAIMWMVQALNNKILFFHKISFYQKAFVSFFKQFPTEGKASIFEGYAKLYSVLGHPKRDKKLRFKVQYSGKIFNAFSDCLGNFIALPSIRISGRVGHKDFSFANMHHVDFEKIKFHKMDFSNADLTNTRWIECQFKECNFEGANLDGASSKYFQISITHDDILVVGSIPGEEANQAFLFALYALSAWGFSKKEKQFLKTLIRAIEEDSNTLFAQHYAIVQKSLELSERLKEKLVKVMDISRLSLKVQPEPEGNVEVDEQVNPEDVPGQAWEPDQQADWFDAQQDGMISQDLHQRVSHPDSQIAEVDEWAQPASSVASNSVYSAGQTFFSQSTQDQLPLQAVQVADVGFQQLVDNRLPQISTFERLFGCEPVPEMLEVGEDYYYGNYDEENPVENNMDVNVLENPLQNGDDQNVYEGDGMDVDTDDNRSASSSSSMSFGKRN